MTTGASPRIDSLTPGTQGFVDQSATIAAGTGNFITTIVGRAPIPDIANDLRASFGIDRIQTQQIQLLQSEQGANGEPVYSVVNDDRGLVRFVGQWVQSVGTYGQYIQTTGSNSTDYVEITFYGMGINLLSFPNSAAPTVSYDGGSAVTLSAMTGGSQILGNRNVNSNTLYSGVSVLALGLHTAKITSGTQLLICGFEILNATSGSSNININAGNAYYKGLVYNNAAADSIHYNQDFSGNTIFTGTHKGGRIVRYMTASNVFGHGATAVNASGPQYGNSAVHAGYEEAARVYYPREFGAGNYNATYGSETDFSLMINNFRASAFTLDDGTTTLVASSGAITSFTAGIEGVYINPTATNTLTFTFVGCGLDILLSDDSANSTSAYTYQIDGGSSTPWFYSTGSTALRTQKVASGLSYGTHTFTATMTTSTSCKVTFTAFKVYQPLKPSVPAGAVEICDYNVMGTYAAATNTGNSPLFHSTGVLTKTAMRELVYVGSWTPIMMTSSVGYVHGWMTYTSTTNDYIQYTFYGTGFDFRYQAYPDGGTSILVSLQNLSTGGSMLPLTTGNFSFSYSTYGVTGKFNATNGTLDQTGTATGCGLCISGLPLAVYTVKILKQAGGTYLRAEGIDIITPIHVHKHNTYATLQNTLSIGSQGMADTRQIDPNTVSNMLSVQPRKAWTQALGVQNTNAQFTSGANTPIPDMFCSIKTSGGPIEIKYSVNVYAATSGSGWVGYQAYVDGLIPSGTANQTFVNYTYNDQILLIDTITVPVSPGFHVVHVWASSNSVTLALNGVYRKLTVREI